MKERIAKRIAAAGVCSRRDAEKMIAEGRVRVNGIILDTPALVVGPEDVILVNDQPLAPQARPRLWAFYKPTDVITTHHDPQGRETLFDILPEKLPRVISVGRLDLNSEGLILLSTSGAIARHAELPTTGWERCYRVRVYGDVDESALRSLKDGITIDGIEYGRIDADVTRQMGANTWLYMVLREGKNREIRRILQHLGLHVNRLIRMTYGPFSVGDLQPGEIKEIPYKEFSPHFPFLTQIPGKLQGKLQERKPPERTRGRNESEARAKQPETGTPKRRPPQERHRDVYAEHDSETTKKTFKKSPAKNAHHRRKI